MKPKLFASLVAPTIFALGASLSPGYPVDKKRLDKKRLGKKCLLKDCEELTNHNGGYCCAEHCRLDREKRRK